jgi:DNA-directed RNA polymerase specialized sigma24 family protein
MGELAAEAAKARVLSDELVEMFYALARRTLNTDHHSIRRKFGFLDADDVIQEAVMRCFLVTLNFDETKLKNKHDAYFFFRVIIIQTFLRLYKWHTRQKRTPEHGIISLNSDRSSRVQDRLDRCNRQEYLGGGGGEDDLDYYEFAEEAIAEIRRQCNNGAKLEEIAHEYGVEVETITDLLNRK